MNELTPQQLQIIGQIAAIPGAAQLLSQLTPIYLAAKFEEDIAADPNITDPEQIREFVATSGGYVQQIFEDAARAAANA